ncbi:hypothetical protein ABL78_4569 [Leptomonas seymouri]|uniref:Uncharacterized protein n=1 Tax=Leptomonas seymouri TaxID=5684 RepID=A0A0N1PDZ7_LEPSE|nr:hypothetical protein ABL78_4569 [Leptomonas seymouri]|eukprot:KPI86383.1 hypothetical protein ABL78_4569 [Leptomonas seymouri]
MEGRKADVTAFQLAAELASHASSSASASPPSAFAAAAVADDGPSGNQSASGKVGAAKRGPRSQLHHLLHEQRRFALRDGSPCTDAGKLRAPTRSMAMASTLLMQRMPGDMYGADASVALFGKAGSASGTHATSESAVAAGALQETVLRWGAMKNGQVDGSSGVDVGACGWSDGHGGLSPSFPSLRHVWRLIETERRPTRSLDPAQPISTTASTPTHLRSLRQRWERSDDLMQANTLLKAVQGEMAQQRRNGVERPITASTGDHHFYLRGLQLCAESVYSSTSLPTYFTASSFSLSPTLSFFSFTEEEYNALAQPPPPPSLPSTFTFTYAASCYLFELWSRFGNPVVVADRWAWDTGREQPLQPHTASLHSFTLSSSSRGRLPPSTSVASQQERNNAALGAEATVRCRPSVEQICAEYSRVTSGVLQQRQQRLLRAVLTQQGHQQPQGSGARAPATAAAVAASSASGASAKTHTPFIASFGRYALLHAVKDDGEGENRTSNVEAVGTAPLLPQLPLPSQPSPPPIDPRKEEASKRAANVVSAGGFADTLSSVSSLHALQDPSTDLTPQQRLAACTTPHPWYMYTAERQRRAVLAELLCCEGAANVPYQQAVATYLALATSAAQALQRAASVFDDRDRVEAVEEGGPGHEAAKRNATQGKANEEVRISGTPPRDAFTVQLQPLLNVDPAAWKAAEAVLRKAAIEVLGTSTSRLPSGAQQRHCPTSRGKRHRSSTPAADGSRVDAPRIATKRMKGEGGESDRAATVGPAASSSVARKQHSEEPAAIAARAKEVSETDDEEEGADGGLGHGSSESSVTAKSKSEDSEENEEVDRDEGVSSEDSEHDGEDVDSGGEAAHLLQKQDELSEGVDEESASNAERASQQPPRRGGRRGRSISMPSSSPNSKSQPSHLNSDPTYRALQEYITDVIPFRCTRLRVAAQAGWLLPAPPALPHSLADPLGENEVVLVDVHGALRQQRCKQRETAGSGAAVDADEGGGRDASDGASLHNDATVLSNPSTASAVNAEPASGASRTEEDLYQPILTEEDYQELRKVGTSAVCNRVVSHTGEAVLLSLPPTLPRVHREVEQELERYLYDDTSAMMEVNAMAQSLIAEIRVAYTQGIYLQRYMARLEHIVGSLRKVEQDCKEAEKNAGGGGAAAGDPTTSL